MALPLALMCIRGLIWNAVVWIALHRDMTHGSQRDGTARVGPASLKAGCVAALAGSPLG